MMTYVFMNNSWANELERTGAQYSWTRAELPGKPVSNQTPGKKNGQ